MNTMKTTAKLFSLLIGILILTNSCSIFEEDEDYTPPSEITNLSAEVIDNSVKLSWTNPPEDRFDRVSITYSNAVFESNDYATVNDGSEEILLTDLYYNVEYLFSLRAVSETGHASNAVEITVTIGPNESNR